MQPLEGLHEAVGLVVEASPEPYQVGRVLAVLTTVEEAEPARSEVAEVWGHFPAVLYNGCSSRCLFLARWLKRLDSRMSPLSKCFLQHRYQHRGSNPLFYQEQYHQFGTRHRSVPR